MGATQDILSNLDINQIASVLGQDPQTVEAAAATAVDSLVSGMENSVSDEQSAVAFANALGQHAGSPAANGQVDLNMLDLNDGASIVNHVLEPQQQRQLFSGAQGQLVQKLLPIVAPIVMAYLAKQLQGQGGLGGMLGQILGGQAAQQQAGAGDLGSILGQILGGSQSGAPNTTAPASIPAGGGLGDILGQVLGGQAAAPAGAPAQGGLPDPGLGGQAGQAGAAASVGGLLKSILFG